MRIKHPELWISLEEVMLYTTEYENFREILEIIEKVKGCEELSDRFWHRMIDKLMSWKDHWTSRDMIDLMKIF